MSGASNERAQGEVATTDRALDETREKRDVLVLMRSETRK